MSLFVTAQESTNIDSLLQVYKFLPSNTTKVNIIDDIFKYYRENDTSKLKGYVQEQLTLSKKIGYQKGIAKSWNNYANFYYSKKTWDSAKIYYEKALRKFETLNAPKEQSEIRYTLAGVALNNEQGYDESNKIHRANIEFYKKIQDTNFLAKSYSSIAWNHLVKGNYYLALDQNIKAIDYLEKLKDSTQLSQSYRLMSAIECELMHHKKALEYAEKCLLFKKANSKHFIGGVYNTMGIIYTNQKDFKKADSIFDKALDLAIEVDNKHLQKLALINHSRSFEDREDYNSALDKVKAYLDIEKELPEKRMSSLGFLGMGSVLVKLDKAKEAKIYLDKAVIKAKIENVKSRMILAYQNRAEAFLKLNDYKMAYEDYKMYATLKDSVYNEAKSKQIEEMRAIFDTEKKEQEIINQKNEIELLTVKDEVNNLQKLLLALGLFIALISTYAFFQRNRKNRLEKEKAKADLEFKTKELTTHALHLAKKNEVLNDLKQKAKILKADANADPGYQMLIQTINFDLQDDNNWENFSKYFEQVHKGFNNKAQELFPNITANDLRLMALLKMNLSSKEIANILNISSDGIKKARQRLRKKMGIDSNVSLEAIVIAI
ncbi:hypothetical protein [Aquimarina sp. SS2-1]|uniref:tetratricopeptide repeat protein n=1 Tax=Aquimarina besae TaxID=3342247 RepID=UPI003671B78B